MEAQRDTGLWATVCLLGFLPAFTNVRIGDLQLEDFALVLLLGFCIYKFAYSCLSFRISSKLSKLFFSYGLLLVVLLVLSVFALRLTFYPLDDASFLKRPVIFSLSKLFQFAAVLCGFFWLTNVFMKRKSLLGPAMTGYWLSGIVSSCYAIVCYVVLAVHRFDPPDIFGAYLTPEGGLRAGGFFNEGGPFGVYLISVFIVGLLRRRISGRRLGWVNIVLLAAAFILSSSKAGFLAGALLGLYVLFSAVSLKKRAAYFILATAALGATAMWLNVGEQLVGYFLSYQNIEQSMAVRGRDYGLITGRVAGLIIVPKMILTHPVAGIGYGNYPLMRNDPLYLGVLPAVTEAQDLPSLGIPGIMAEMGIPATIWLVMLLFIPYWVNRRKGAMLRAALLFQPVAHIFNVQLTFFYPWFVTACALAASSYGWE